MASQACMYHLGLILFVVFLLSLVVYLLFHLYALLYIDRCQYNTLLALYAHSPQPTLLQFRKYLVLGAEISTIPQNSSSVPSVPEWKKMRRTVKCILHA